MCHPNFVPHLQWFPVRYRFIKKIRKQFHLTQPNPLPVLQNN